MDKLLTQTVRQMRSYNIALPPTCQFCHSSLSLTSSLHPIHICWCLVC